ncbi:MAG: hypothetical protein AAB733_01805 [Patescibacteria group bacterium]
MATKQKTNTIEGESVLGAAIVSVPKKRKPTARRKPAEALKVKSTPSTPRPVRHQKRSVRTPKRQEIAEVRTEREEVAHVEAEGAAILVLTVVLLAILLIVGGFLYLSFSL